MSYPLTIKTSAHIHFIGIGGAGMVGIADVLLEKGYCVTGSDLLSTAATHYLQGKGAKIFTGHAASQCDGADIVVFSAAIPEDNPEMMAAQLAHIPLISRAEMLGHIMNLHYGVSVAGTHGKTTTSSLLATLFCEAGLDPSFVIGGCLTGYGASAQRGSGRFFIAEADESDASFLHLSPQMIVLTNIDADHLEAYGGEFLNLQNAFLNFIKKVPPDGLAVLCIDDDVIQSLLPTIRCPVKTFGLSDVADVRGINIVQEGLLQRFTVSIKKANTEFNVSLNLPGKHNVLNALGAITIALAHDIPPNVIARTLQHFQGTDRRFTVYHNIQVADSRVTVVNDYGHHPQALIVTLNTCREAFTGRRIVWIFQPHRYTRTQDCFNAFCTILQKADVLILMDVYSAGEKPIPGADGHTLFSALKGDHNSAYHFAKTSDDVMALLPTLICEGDVILCQGAGTIQSLVDQLCFQPREAIW